MPIVTVVIPLFNKATDVERTVRSVLAQSQPDFELIVVDDGSTDGGGDVVRAIGDPRIRTIRQANAGVSAARNRGIAEAATDLVALLDADDEWRPDFLRSVLELRSRFPQAGLWAAGYLMAPPDSGPLKQPQLRGVPTAPEGGLIDDFFVCLRKDCPVCSSNVLGRRSIFEALGGFAVGEKLSEDWDMWARIALRYRVAFLPEVQAVYHLDASNRAMLALRYSGEETRLARTLRDAIASGRFEHTTREQLAAILSGHLSRVAKACMAAGRGARARELLSEARRYHAGKSHWRRLWVKSYLGPGLNRFLRAFRGVEKAIRHRARDGEGSDWGGKPPAR
jgi:glycosyltransferase involved in cell wall biosynthesis